MFLYLYSNTMTKATTRSSLKNTAGTSPPSTPKKKCNSPPSTPKKKWKWSPGDSRVMLSDSGNGRSEQKFDLFQTLVDGVYIGICTKSWSSNEASYLWPMESSLNQQVTGEKLAKDWKWVFGILPRRDVSVDDGTTVMKSKSGSKWPWKVIVVVVNDECSADTVGNHIAASFTKFTKSTELMDTSEKYIYRHCISDDPKALNYYLLDLDVARILKALGGYKSKDELMEEEEESALAAFYGTSDRGRTFIASLSDEDWENLDV